MLLAAASTLLHPPFQCSIVLNEGPPNPCVMSALPPSIRRTFKERKEETKEERKYERKEEREVERKEEKKKEKKEEIKKKGDNTLSLVYVPINQSQSAPIHTCEVYTQKCTQT